MDPRFECVDYLSYRCRKEKKLKRGGINVGGQFAFESLHLEKKVSFVELSY